MREQVWPLASPTADMCKYDVIHIPEVHTVSQRSQMRSDPRTQAACANELVKIGLVVPEICSRVVHTDKHTNRHAHHNTPPRLISTDVDPI